MAIPPTIPPGLPCQGADYLLLYEYLRCWAERRLPKIPYYRLATPTSQIDDIHHEIIDTEKTWRPYVYVAGWLESTNTEQNQEKMGQDFIDEFMLYIPLPALVTAGLATVDYEYKLEELYTQNGDRFWHEDHLYEIQNAIDTSMWGYDGRRGMWYEYKVDNVRPSAAKQGGVGYDFNPAE